MKKVRSVLLLSMSLAVVALIGLCGAAAPQEETTAEAPIAVAGQAPPSGCDEIQCPCACSPLAGAWVARLSTADDQVPVAAGGKDDKGGKDGKDDKKVRRTIKTFKFAPVNAACDRFVVNAQATTRPQRVILAFPELTDLTEFVGIACQADACKVDFTAIGYGIKRAGKCDTNDETVLIAVLSGTVQLPKAVAKPPEVHKCRCCEKSGCKDPKCSCKTGDYTAPSKHGHPGKCCCCVDGCKYSDCECKTGKYPDCKDKDKDKECFEPEELCAELTAAYYDANADKDGDGFPDKGEKPVICLSYDAKFKRVELQPPCKPAK